MDIDEKQARFPGLLDEGIDDLDENASYHPLVVFPRKAETQARFVTRLWIRNMKGFQNFETEFGAFNVLVGPNNCGKSTILQAIDLCFRLIQYHAEFQRGLLVRPRGGKRIIEEMLPVAEPEDFWWGRKTRVGNERIPVTVGIELDAGHRFEFEIRRLWGGLNSRMTQIPDGLAEDLVRGILARRPTYVPCSSGVVKREEFRTLARLEILSMTGHHNEVLRNHLRDLAIKHPERYKTLQNVLQHHFGGSVGRPVFSSEEDQYISLDYEEGDLRHDVFSAGGGFLQVLQVLTYLYLQTPGIALLDEPDAHLHSSLQRLVVDLLDVLNKQDKVQVIIATHSKEIINYVDASHIIPISRGHKHAQPLEHHRSVLPILQDLGSIDNADLAALVASKRCVFVEGPSDRKLLARFAGKLGSTVFEGVTQVVTIPTNGVDHPEKYVGLDIFERVVGTPIGALVIRDRDGLPDDLLDEMRSSAAKQGRQVFVLSKTHLENYLLLPQVIWRVIGNKLRERPTADKQPPSTQEVQKTIEDVLLALHDETFDSIVTHIDQHFHAYHNKHLDPTTLNQRARAFLADRWVTMEQKLSIVLGKQALRAIRRTVQDTWGVSFTDNDLIEEMTADEIAPEIKEIVTKLESL